MEILRDSIWQFVGVLLSIIAIGISIYIFVKQRETKQILCEVVSNSPVVRISREIQSGLEIRYKGKAVQDLRLIILKLQNTGTLPISSKDFEEPISFFIGQESEILDVEIVTKTPKSLNPHIVNNSSILRIEPLLLNSKDTFTLKIIALKAADDIEIGGRILGLKDITKTLPSRPNFGVFSSIILMMIVLFFVMLGYIMSDFLRLLNP